MVYRDALSAALARISALEAEVVRLERELASARGQKRAPRAKAARKQRTAQRDLGPALRRVQDEIGRGGEARTAGEWMKLARQRGDDGDWLGAVACYDLAKRVDDNVDDPPQVAAEMAHALKQAQRSAK